MNIYYHNSPTPKQLKAIKRAKAIEMKQHTDAMKLVTAKYAHALSQLEKLRAMELDIGNNIHQDRYDEQQLTYVTEVMAKNQRKAARMVSKLTGVQDILS